MSLKLQSRIWFCAWVALSAALALFCRVESAPVSDSPNVLVSSLASMTRGFSQDSTVDGADFFQSMADAAAGLNSYSVSAEMSVFKDGKTIHEHSNFYFKKPGLIRAEELGPYKKGAVAVVQKDGKMRGHLGGMLSKFSATIDPRSSWAASANDYPLIDSDFYSMSKVMLGFLKSGNKSFVTEHPVIVSGQPKAVYVIELCQNSSGRELMKRAYIDPQTLLPVEWFDYKNGKLFAHTIWKDLRTNINLADSLFEL